jgi:hypothetical protein
LQVAFEAENGADWRDELCKLAHIVAELRVLVTYQSHCDRTAADALRGFLKDRRDRILRVPGSRWLFIFGPDWREPSACWEAWTLDDAGELIALDDPEPLTGQSMGCA